MFIAGWNVEVIKTLSKADFVKMHEHMKDNIDLEAEYDKIVPPVNAQAVVVSTKKEKAVEPTTD